AAFTLAAVCRRWRELSLESPRLWCDVQFNTSKARRGILSQYISLMLSRSNDLSLNVVTHCGEPEGSVCERSYTTFSKLVPRVRKLHVDLVAVGTPQSTSYSVLGGLLHSTPRLEICSIYCEHNDWDLVEIDEADYFLPDAPILRSLDV
ncbi:hypothetical protein BKA62DRAFT_592003, partial [Auriculariales sp. MPI-PUGE-AT-0066]